MGQARYIIGVDLGTTNSAMAYVDLADPGEVPPIRLFQIPQLASEATTAPHPTLPSFLYLPGQHDLPAGATALPWDAQRPYVVGAFARDQGARVPARLVSSAKSWLCHGGVDRQSPVLPWGSPSDVPHLSPVEASTRYLLHMREAWDREMSQGRSEWCLAESEVVLTVPASFDEVARELTVTAAQQAGFCRFTLLEEPQAAFYSWIRSQGDDWSDQLSDGQLVLVFDVGGGTTDFSLIAVRGSGTETTLERVAVGDHLLLGGDNMDLALARHLERRLLNRIGELDPNQWATLIHSCRAAKEALLSNEETDRQAITIAGRGRKVVGGSVRVDLFRDEVNELVLDGFFPAVDRETPLGSGRAGLQELGLPYASDAAITRHLAAFLRRHQAQPDVILFNGGAMKAALAQDRVLETVSQWFNRPPVVLESSSLDLAVALGAATYGLARAGQGVRIRGGTARAYYVGVADASPGERKGVCLIPFGVEEGDEVHIDRTLDLVTGRPVSFPLYTSTAPLGHDPGDVVAVTPEFFTDLLPLHTVLPGESTRGATHETVPVTLGAKLSEVGTLRVWCAKHPGGTPSWDLEFTVRKDASDEATPRGPAVGDHKLDVSDEVARAADTLIRQRFAQRDPEQARTLIKDLEQTLDAERLAWPGTLIRLLWSPLWEAEEARRTSPEHEAAWLSLAGILLRPGFGDPFDGDRIAALWGVFRDGMRHPDTPWCRIGWWVLWRRVSGGLSRGQQLELSNRLAPPLLSGTALKAAGGGKKGKKGANRGGGGPNRQELAEMWRAVASLEHVPASSKEGLGDIALRNAAARRGDFAYWALGRLGARVPLYGPVEDVVRTAKVAQWLDRLLSLDWQKERGAVLAVAQLARRCGDDNRDIAADLRARILERLHAQQCAESLIRLVSEVTVLEHEQQAQLYGDALPTGLRL